MPTATKVKSANAAKTGETIIEQGKLETLELEGGIIVRDINVIRPKTLPLIVELPEDASEAQKEFAKVLNGFAYQFPDKWEKRKGDLFKELVAKKNAPDPIVNPDMRLEVINRAAPKNVI